MVIIITSASHCPDDLLNILWDTVIADASDTSLPEDPRGWQALKTRLECLELPAMWGIRSKRSEQELSGDYRAVQESPGLLNYINGAGEKESSGFGSWNGLRIRFEERELVLTCVQQKKEFPLRVALDGTFCRQTIDGREYAATGRWRGMRRFELEARDMETACGARITLDFHGENHLSLTRDFTLPGAEDGRESASPLVFAKA